MVNRQSVRDVCPSCGYTLSKQKGELHVLAAARTNLRSFRTHPIAKRQAALAMTNPFGYCAAMP